MNTQPAIALLLCEVRYKEANCLFCCMVRRRRHFCRRIYGSWRPFTCVANVWSSGYAGMTLSETQKLSTGPTSPSVRDVIAKRQNSLFGHVVRLDDHTPAHRALSQVAAARTGHRFGPGWRRQPGRPRHSWIQQIGDGTPFSIRAEWSRARRRGHSGLTQRTSAVYTIWWWLWTAVALSNDTVQLRWG